MFNDFQRALAHISLERSPSPMRLNPMKSCRGSSPGRHLNGVFMPLPWKSKTVSETVSHGKTIPTIVF